MNLIWHFIVNVVLSLLFSIGALAAVNAVLLISGRVNPRQVKFAITMRHVLHTATSDAIFECQGREVSAIRYNYDTDQDQIIHIYTANYASPLSWHGGRLVTTELRRRANMEIAIGMALLLLVITPLCAACAWLALTRWWPWWLVIAVIIAAQTATSITGKFVVTWNRATVSGIFAIFILHRYNAFSSSLLLTIDTAWFIGILTLIVWLEKLDNS